MVPQIDFLPATYHVQRQREHTTLWRRMMVFFFLALAVLGTWQQREIRRKLETRRGELQARAVGLQQSAVPSEDQTQKKLRELESRSLLSTTLNLRVPTTRLLAALTTSLPPFVNLIDCQADWAPVETTAPAGAKVSVPSSSTNASEKLSPVDTDLKELQALSQRQVFALTIHGLAPDDLDITRYLGNLRQSDLFDRITLVVSNQHRVHDETMRHFEVRLQVKSAMACLSPNKPTHISEQRSGTTTRVAQRAASSAPTQDNRGGVTP